MANAQALSGSPDISGLFADLSLARDLFYGIPVTELVGRRSICSGGRTISSRLMMKIETKHVSGQLIFQVEGRLAGAFVPELERCWQAARAARPDRKISLDLKSVTCVDMAGRRLLQSMHDGGVDFRGAKMATQDILDQLSTPCDH